MPWYPETLVFKMPICHVLKRLLGAGCLLGASLCWVPSWLSPCCMVTPVNPKWNEKQQHQIALQKCEDTICNRNIMFFFVLFCFQLGDLDECGCLCCVLICPPRNDMDMIIGSEAHDSNNSLTFQDQEMWIHCMS